MMGAYTSTPTSFFTLLGWLGIVALICWGISQASKASRKTKRPSRTPEQEADFQRRCGEVKTETTDSAGMEVVTPADPPKVVEPPKEVHLAEIHIHKAKVIVHRVHKPKRRPRRKR